MWTSNNWFSYRRDALEEALENVAEGMAHTVDWDGPSQVKVTNKTPNEVEVRRIDAKGNVLSGDEHVMIYSKGEPEFHRIMSDEGNYDDHEAWREKRAASLQGRSYHESANLDEVSMKTLSSYSIKASEQIDEKYKDPWKAPRKGSIAWNAAQQSKKADRDPEEVKRVNAIGNKKHMVGTAKVTHNEEVEQIDEISKKTLVDYMDKSKKETKVLQKKYNADKLTPADEKKYDRRVTGQIAAMDKFHGRSKVPASGVDKAYDAAQKALKNESYLTEGATDYGDFELSVEPKSKRSEGHPSHVVAHVRKMSKLGVPAHDNDDYGDTVAIRVKNTKTGASTLHHVYQRGKSSRDDESTKRLVSVRPAGPNRLETHEHNEVIMNYLSGKRPKAK